MMSMNIRPPRPIADRKVESVPKVNALILNSRSRNIGIGRAHLDDGERDQQRRPRREQREDRAGLSSPSDVRRPVGSRR